MGVSFLSFLSQIRMKRAIQLLNATELTIHDIAGQVGYLTQHYFSTSFKKHMGISPNQYRRGGLSGVPGEEPDKQ
jgi:two-component system response regulator YesN